MNASPRLDPAPPRGVVFADPLPDLLAATLTSHWAEVTSCLTTAADDATIVVMADAGSTLVQAMHPADAVDVARHLRIPPPALGVLTRPAPPGRVRFLVALGDDGQAWTLLLGRAHVARGGEA